MRLEHAQKRGVDQRTLWRGGLCWSFHELYDAEYPPEPSLWEDGLLSSLILSGAVFPHIGKFRIFADARMETDAPYGDFSYIRTSLESAISYPLNNTFTFSLRGFLGSASDGTPVQVFYGLGGGGPLAQSNVRWLRAWASLPPDWNARAIGEGNLSGYSASQYLARNVATLGGQLAAKLKFFDSFMDNVALPSRFRPNVEAFLFAGAGDLGSSLSGLKHDDRLEEAGLGISLDFISGSRFEVALPLYLSNPPEDEEKWDWRAVIGFSIPK